MQKRPRKETISAKETYNLKEPTTCIHPILIHMGDMSHSRVCVVPNVRLVPNVRHNTHLPGTNLTSPKDGKAMGTCAREFSRETVLRSLVSLPVCVCVFVCMCVCACACV